MAFDRHPLSSSLPLPPSLPLFFFSLSTHSAATFTLYAENDDYNCCYCCCCCCCCCCCYYTQHTTPLHNTQRSNIHAEYDDYRTSVEGVFAAGDCESVTIVCRRL